MQFASVRPCLGRMIVFGELRGASDGGEGGAAVVCVLGGEGVGDPAKYEPLFDDDDDDDEKSCFGGRSLRKRSLRPGGGLAGFSSEPACVRYDVVYRMISSLDMVAGGRGCDEAIGSE